MKTLQSFPIRKRRPCGFTLVELLVVVVIVAALSSLVFMMSTRAIGRAERAKVIQQMRDVGLGIEAYVVDYKRPPIPESKRITGWDTIYGDPGGNYGNESLMAALLGENNDFPTNTDEIFNSRDMNPRQNNYFTPVVVSDNKSGIGQDDGKFYDAWGRELMFAINTPPFDSEFSNGQNDKRMMTWGLAEWSDKQPRHQSYVIWSYGKDGEKSEAYAGADDVANF